MELDVDGRRITLHARGAGAPLVCLPGGPGFPASHLGDLGGLDADRTLLVPDWRGAGRSDPPVDGRHGLADYAADVGVVQEALGTDRIDLFGHSFGGAVALTYAADHPGRVRCLVLDGTPDQLADGRAPDGEGLAGFFARWDDRAREYAESLLPTHYEPALEWFAEHEYDDLDLRATLARVAVPTLVLTGDRDWACGRERAAAMADLLVDGEVAVIDQAGHFAWVEAPDANRAAVLGFLRRHSEC